MWATMSGRELVKERVVGLYLSAMIAYKRHHSSTRSMSFRNGRLLSVETTTVGIQRLCP